MSHIQGTVEAGFGKVADAFASNFEHDGEVGAAFCLHVGGEIVIDVWGGVADPATGRAYTGDTLQMVFSTTKGATALCAAMLMERGQLDVDAPVATYWPEFAANGKERIPVRWILNQAGLPVIDVPMTFDDALAVTPVLDALAAQAPVWEPGSAHGYHGITYGWLVGEIVRRITGRRLSTWFADEVAAPLDLDFWIGLPADEEARVAPLLPAAPPDDPDVLALMAAVMGPDTLGYRMLTIEGAFPLGDDSWINTRALHAAEIPAINGITTARSLSRMYAATVGPVDGVRLLQPATVDAVRANQTHGVDRCLMVESRFGLGFGLDSDLMPLLSRGSFGHAGAGGSLGFADPEAGVGFGYVMNQMAGGLAGDPRTLSLIDAARAALG
jgi:CubicO group peptidase (beta-lactamase class C family)